MTRKAKILAQLIEQKGYSRRAFAEEIGIPATTLQSMLTRGIGRASVDNVIKVFVHTVNNPMVFTASATIPHAIAANTATPFSSGPACA